jgi:hypothetical protein
MTIKFEINMTNKWLYSLIVIGVLLAFGVGVWAYEYLQSIPNPGHKGDSVLISINGQEKTIQQAIDDGDFGGNYEYKYPQCVHCNWTGWRCVDQEDGPYDWYGNCQNQCIVEVKTGQYC